MLPEHFTKLFAAREKQTALVFPDRQYHYGDLFTAIQKTAGWLLQYGVNPGDRIAVLMTPSIESILIYLAGLFSGTILIPLNPRYTDEEIQYFLDDAAVSLFIHPADIDSIEYSNEWKILIKSKSGKFREEDSTRQFLSTIEKVNPDHNSPSPDPLGIALLCYTSGTTGKPKGAMITHENLAAMASCLYTAWGWSADDVLLHTLPLFHVHGLLVALQGALYAGAQAIIEPHFEAETVLQRLGHGDCTLFMGVPTMYNRFVGARPSLKPSLEHIRLFISGSAPLSSDIFRGFQKRFGHTVLERYGMTEAGMVLSNPLRKERKAGSVGIPLPGVSVRIVDSKTGQKVLPGSTGELLIRSKSVCKGYWQKPEATEEAFVNRRWLQSGDMARQDEEGYYYLVGRKKELIITGGFNVYPREVEQVLENHPMIKEAAIFGQEDRDLGESVCAAVVLKDRRQVGEKNLINLCRQSLTPYKCPKKIYFVDKLPRNAMGKILKGELSKLFSSQ